LEKASREDSGKVVQETLREQPSIWKGMKEKALARRGFVALSAPEAEREEK